MCYYLKIVLFNDVFLYDYVWMICILLNVYLIYLNGVDTCMLYKMLIHAYWFLVNEGLHLNANIIRLWCIHA